LKLVLDTTICSDYAEGLPEVVEAIVQYGQFLFLPAIVLGELTYGFLKSNRQTYNEKKLMQLYWIHKQKFFLYLLTGRLNRKCTRTVGL
jgi:predicted nucleic acid-binding protein